MAHFLSSFEQSTEDLVSHYLRSIEQVLDELDNETRFIDGMLDFRVERERYLDTVAKDLKDLRKIEWPELDLMYDFIDWVTYEVRDLIKLAKRDDVDELWKVAPKIIKDRSSFEECGWVRSRS